MWVARVLERPDGYMRRRTCLSCKAVNSKKLLPVPFQKQVAFAMLLVAVHALEGENPADFGLAPDPTLVATMELEPAHA